MDSGLILYQPVISDIKDLLPLAKTLLTMRQIMQ